MNTFGGRLIQPPTFLEGAVEGFRAYLHLLKLLWQYQGADEHSAVAVVQGNAQKEHVPLNQGFALKGTTFVFKTVAGGHRRIPALQVSAIEDKYDYGY